MKKFLLTMAAVGAVATAASPAAAQSWRDQNDGYSRYDSRQDWRDRQDWRSDRGDFMPQRLGDLDRAITRAAQERRISWRDARQLHSELTSVGGLAYLNKRGTITRTDYRRLVTTVRDVEMRLNRYADNDDRRYDDRGWRH